MDFSGNIHEELCASFNANMFKHLKHLCLTIEAWIQLPSIPSTTCLKHIFIHVSKRKAANEQQETLKGLNLTNKPMNE